MAGRQVRQSKGFPNTLQRHLTRGGQPDTGQKRLYVVDESSLASTKQMYQFVERLHWNDRVLLVGDTRQHESIEAADRSLSFRKLAWRP